MTIRIKFSNFILNYFYHFNKGFFKSLSIPSSAINKYKKPS